MKPAPAFMEGKSASGLRPRVDDALGAGKDISRGSRLRRGLLPAIPKNLPDGERVQRRGLSLRDVVGSHAWKTSARRFNGAAPLPGRHGFP